MATSDHGPPDGPGDFDEHRPVVPFFASYLIGLAIGGVVPSIIASNPSVAALSAARRAWRPVERRFDDNSFLTHPSSLTVPTPDRSAEAIG